MPTDIKFQANISPSSPARPAPVVAKTAGDVGVDAAEQQEATAAASNPTPPAANPEQLRNAMSQLSNYVQSVQRNLNFSIDESSGQTVIKVIDSESEEIIRQIPSEEMLALARRLNELNGEQVSGLLMQSKA
ncbi:MAG: flagellar biosynthesis protein FlaG [Gammaproteobacteria bacterium HGW-Gammaproteobacteria-1]|jgi:flagellar protein FlaG|nr:MAG: flagellar biosynthesis protein FlaG [Gammaproteobacteria bacterium HGW-Gammaproteobacteria-1]